MLVVGLTGGIATGKSTVSSLLAQHQIPIVDADLLARQVVQRGTPGLKKIVAAFGGQVLLPDGDLDRKKLGEIVFGDPIKRKVLERIIHPAVRRAMLWEVCRAWMRGERVVVLDVPLLIEAGLYAFVGRVVVVYTSKQLQTRRLISRDHLTPQQARQRVAAQKPMKEKLQYADFVIDNSGQLPELQQQVTHLVRQLDDLASPLHKLCWFFPPFGLLAAGWCLLWRWVQRTRAKGRRRRWRGPAPEGERDEMELDDIAEEQEIMLEDD
ncbi:CoaE-domain-containing protein [Calocera cornea HHB12733]|uniref:CoaE-domain-containing protein n=1 Tax=Calocera cornea HHB12733 TaxID=1353952 RepID=A0A165DU69_9BASI|nr:CoaE-domain-containing protein [Calocera cornea HHB12733]